jgi:PGF-pre-PGF domain-containing protein
MVRENLVVTLAIILIVGFSIAYIGQTTFEGFAIKDISRGESNKILPEQQDVAEAPEDITPTEDQDYETASPNSKDSSFSSESFKAQAQFPVEIVTFSQDASRSATVWENQRHLVYVGNTSEYIIVVKEDQIAGDMLYFYYSIDGSAWNLIDTLSFPLDALHGNAAIAANSDEDGPVVHITYAYSNGTLAYRVLNKSGYPEPSCSLLSEGGPHEACLALPGCSGSNFYSQDAGMNCYTDPECETWCGDTCVPIGAACAGDIECCSNFCNSSSICDYQSEGICAKNATYCSSGYAYYDSAICPDIFPYNCRITLPTPSVWEIGPETKGASNNLTDNLTTHTCSYPSISSFDGAPVISAVVKNDSTGDYELRWFYGVSGQWLPNPGGPPGLNNTVVNHVFDVSQSTGHICSSATLPKPNEGIFITYDYVEGDAYIGITRLNTSSFTYSPNYNLEVNPTSYNGMLSSVSIGDNAFIGYVKNGGFSIINTSINNSDGSLMGSSYLDIGSSISTSVTGHGGDFVAYASQPLGTIYRSVNFGSFYPILQGETGGPDYKRLTTALDSPERMVAYTKDGSAIVQSVVDFDYPTITNRQVSRSGFYPGQNVCVSAIVYDNDGDLNTSSIYAHIDQNAFPNNYPMTDTGCSCCGSAGDDLYGYDFSAGPVGDIYYMATYASDTAGHNIGSTNSITSILLDPSAISCTDLIAAFPGNVTGDNTRCNITGTVEVTGSNWVFSIMSSLYIKNGGMIYANNSYPIVISVTDNVEVEEGGMLRTFMPGMMLFPPPPFPPAVPSGDINISASGDITIHGDVISSGGNATVLIGMPPGTTAIAAPAGKININNIGGQKTEITGDLIAEGGDATDLSGFGNATAGKGGNIRIISPGWIFKIYNNSYISSEGGSASLITPPGIIGNATAGDGGMILMSSSYSQMYSIDNTSINSQGGNAISLFNNDTVFGGKGGDVVIRHIILQVKLINSVINASGGNILLGAPVINPAFTVAGNSGDIQINSDYQDAGGHKFSMFENLTIFAEGGNETSLFGGLGGNGGSVSIDYCCGHIENVTSHISGGAFSIPGVPGNYFKTLDCHPMYTNITGCGFTLQSDTKYLMNNDLTCSGTFVTSGGVPKDNTTLHICGNKIIDGVASMSSPFIFDSVDDVDIYSIRDVVGYNLGPSTVFDFTSCEDIRIENSNFTSSYNRLINANSCKNIHSGYLFYKYSNNTGFFFTGNDSFTIAAGTLPNGDYSTFNRSFRYLNVSMDNSPQAYVHLNVYYDESALEVDESLYKLYLNNGTWYAPEQYTDTYDTNTEEDRVYAIVRQNGFLEPLAPAGCVDSDGDGYNTTSSEDCGLPEEIDCDDSDENVYPGATEVCNGIDDDCDGNTDEDEVCPLQVYYCDDDMDNFIKSGPTPSGDCNTYNCVPPTCSVVEGTDCDDSDDEVHPMPESQDYQLDHNLTVCGDESTTYYGVSVIIDTNNIYLDCNGTTLDGNFERMGGVYADGHSNINISNCVITNYNETGIQFSFVTDAGVYNNNVSNFDYPTQSADLYFYDVDRAEVQNNNFEDADYGIYLESTSENNTFENNSVSNITEWDFYSTDDSFNNSFSRLELDNALISFSYNESIKLVSAQEPDTLPENYSSLGQFIVATNDSADAWMILGFHYNQDILDDAGLDENNLSIWRLNSTMDWSNCTDGGWTTGLCGVNSAEDIVIAGIEEFSIFGPLINGTLCIDEDEDGYNTTSSEACGLPEEIDCDDSDENVYPGATEVCNGIDDDCDTQTDEDDVCFINYYCDEDTDTYLSETISGNCNTFECLPAGCSETVGDDCNDSDDEIYPKLTESNCDDGYDNDCDGNSDCDDNDCDDDPACETGGGGSGGSGGGSRRPQEDHDPESDVWTIVRLYPNLPYSTDAGFYDVDLIFRSILVDENLRYVWIQVDSIDKPPHIFPQEGVDYEYFEITYDGITDENVLEIGFDLRVSKSWAEENGIPLSHIAAYRFDGNNWQELRTSYLTEDGQYYYFRVYSDDLSYFAVIGTPLKVWDMLDLIDDYYAGLKTISDVLDLMSMYYN